MAKVFSNRNARCASVLETMEPRLLFSADPVVGLLADAYAFDPALPDHSDLDLASSAADGATGSVELVLLNDDLPDLDKLLAEIDRESSHRPLAVYQLDSSADGMSQLQTLLAAHENVAAVHLFSHGSAGAFALGGNTIDLDTAMAREADLVAMAELFGGGGDLFLYGCETGSQGEELLAYLSQQLNVDIAASNDTTANAVHGGDWELEVTQGELNYPTLFNDGAAGDWHGVLGTVTVTTLVDTFDAPTSISSIADLIANPGSDGLISLREAIYAANKNNDSDEIILPAGTYLMTNVGSGDDAGDFDVKETLIVRGAGLGQTVIDANGIERVFDIKADDVILEDISLTGGRGSGGEGGGAVELDGLNLELNRIEVVDNSTHEGVGGGFYAKNGSTATIRDSIFADNIAGKNQEPNYRAGGGIYNEGTLSVIRSVFENNASQNGGGIYNKGSLIIEDSSFTGNSSTNAGGGVYSDGGADLQVDRSTFELNTSTLDGAGVWVNENSHFDYVTFSGNMSSDEGGGLFTAGPNNTVENSTFYGNSSSNIGAALKNTGSLNIKGSVFWANTSSLADIIAGTVTSLGFNSWQEAEATIADENDLEAQNPLLSPLQDNGGYVKTHMPAAGSPLIDAGYDGAAIDATRTGQNEIPDIGAAGSRDTQVLEKIYWVDTNENRIYRANTDGSAKQLIHTTADVPFDIEVDSVNGKLYWIESNNHYDNTRDLGSLVRANLDGTGRTVLKSGINFPTGVALDLDNSHIYVSSDHTGDNDSSPYDNKILRFNLDGTGEETIVSGVSGATVPDRMVAPTDVEYDPVTQILYWTDRSVISGTINPEVKMIDIGAAGTHQQLIELDKSAGERAYGLAVEEGTSRVSVATGPNVRFHDYSSSSYSYQTIAGEVRGIAYAEESNGTFITTQSGTVDYIDSSGTANIVAGLVEPGAIAVAYLDPVNAVPVVVNDGPLAVDEGVPKTLTTAVLSANDSDTASADLVYTVTTAPVNGTLENSSGGALNSFSLDDIKAGEVIYVHDSGGATSDQFSFTLTDGLTTTAIDTFSIAITQIDDNPVAVDDAYTLDEGDLVNLDILGNDSDEEGAVDSGSVVIVTPPSSGSVTPHGDGTFDYNHNGNESTGDSFQYTVDDAVGNTSNLATVVLTIDGVNDIPVAVADTATVDEGDNVSINAAGNDTDAEGQLDIASIAIIDAPLQGTASALLNGTINYVHSGSETLSDSLTYTINDDQGLVSDKVTVSISINPLNDAPVALDDNRTVDEGSSNALVVLGNDTDADNSIDIGSIVITAGASRGTASANTDGTITYSHNGSETISDSFDYTVSDVSGLVSNSATVNVTVTPQNDAPVALDNSFSLAEGSSYTIDVLANDSDDDDGLDASSVAIAAPATNGTAVANADGSITYTHNSSETAGDSFTYTVNDPSGAQSNIATVTVSVLPVNDHPVAVVDALNLDEGASGSVAVLSNDIDADDGIDSASVSINGAPSHGSASVNPDGSVTYSHNGSETSNDSFTYTVADITGDVSNSGTVFVSVNAINDAPVATDDTTAVLEGDVVNITVLSNDTDADDGIEPASVAIATAPLNGSATVNPDGSIRYVHSGSETTSDSLKYTVEDVTGAVSNVATVSVAVGSVNDNPVAVDDVHALDEAGFATIPVLANDSDADDGLNPATVSITVGPGNGTAAVNPDGTINYTHNGSETTGDSLSYVVADAAGSLSNPATLTLTVNPVNDSPVASDDGVGTSEGASINIDVLGNDIDADDGLNAATVSIAVPANNGSAVVNADGSITYTHDGSETTSDSFDYTVADISGVTSNSATVSLSIIAINDSPVAVADTQTLNEAAATTVAVLANDTDADDGLDNGSVEIVLAPLVGVATANPDGTITYAHDGSETTSDSFTYTVADVSGVASNAAAVDLAIAPVNDAPVALDDAVSVLEGSLSIDPVVANDTDSDSAIDPSSISITSVPVSGSVSVLPDGNVRYLHDGSETVSDSYQYSIQDADGAVSNTATVTVSVTPVNDQPVAIADAAALNEADSIILPLLDNDTDPDDGLDAASFAIVSAPANGTVTQLASGEIQYQHDGSETSSDSFSYTIADMSGQQSAPAIVTLSIAAVNDIPVGGVDTATVDEHGSVAIAVLANDFDAENPAEPGSIDLVSAPAVGTATVQPDNTVLYIHDGSETVSDTFSYRIEDLEGAFSAPVSVNLTISPVNDSPVLQSDAFVIAEGESAQFDLLANDSDADDGIDASSLLVVSVPQNGTATVNSDGSVNYQHDGGETTTDSFSYSVADTTGASGGEQEVAISVLPVNDDPIAAADTAEVVEAGSVSIAVLANDLDAEDTLTQSTIVLQTGPMHGIVVRMTDGSLVYHHDGSETSSDSFSYSLLDSQGGASAIVPVDLAIEAIDDIPVAVSDVYTVNEGGTGNLTILANDSDQDSSIFDATLEVIEQPRHGDLQLLDEGRIAYSHDGSETTSDSFSYRLVTSAGLASAPALVTLNVTPINDLPVLTVDPTINVNVPFTLELPDSIAIDAEPGALTYSASLPDGVALPDSVAFNADTLTLSVVDTQSNNLPEAVQVTIADAEGGETSLLIYLQSEPGLGAALGGSTEPVLPDVKPQLTVIELVASASGGVSGSASESEAASEPGEAAEVVEASSDQAAETDALNAALAPINVNSVMLLTNVATTPVDSMQSQQRTDNIDSLSKTQSAQTPENEQVVASLLPQDSISLVELFDSMTPLADSEFSLLSSSLDDQRDAADRQGLVVRNVIAGSTVATSAVSVGYVFWLLRGGVLLGSVLTALPAWRFVDPFPVLSQLGDTDAADEESLQSIVESDVAPDTDLPAEPAAIPNRNT